MGALVSPGKSPMHPASWAYVDQLEGERESEVPISCAVLLGQSVCHLKGVADHLVDTPDKMLFRST